MFVHAVDTTGDPKRVKKSRHDPSSISLSTTLVYPKQTRK